jgi:hypothetical protein
MAADQRRVGEAAVALNNEAASASVVAHEDVLVVALVCIGVVLDPLLLDELKLPGEVGVESHEDNAAIVRV